MGRNRDKIAKPSPFVSWKEFDEEFGAEVRRHQDALNKLVRKYGADSERVKWIDAIKSPEKAADVGAGLMARIDAKFEMEARHHEALLAKIEAREPETPRPAQEVA